MNKRTIRSFATGIFLSVCLIGVFYVFPLESGQDEYSLEEARTLLEGKGYIILEESDYHALQEKATIQNNITSEEQEEKEAEEPNKSNQEDINIDQSTSTIINYQLDIVSGMTSNEIAKVLAQNKIVQDETAFTNFLISHDYQTNIQLGSFPLTNQMTFEQIANMITKR